MSKMNKFVLSTLVAAAAMTSTAWAEGTTVAEIGETGYETFQSALSAVKSGEIITLQNVSGSEVKTEMDLDLDGTITITGTAPSYELPVVTVRDDDGNGSKGVVNIESATITIPELDARQNATINVKNSTVADAGGNSIVKSYFNGAINISDASIVDTMQMTTMMRFIPTTSTRMTLHTMIWVMTDGRRK